MAMMLGMAKLLRRDGMLLYPSGLSAVFCFTSASWFLSAFGFFGVFVKSFTSFLMKFRSCIITQMSDMYQYFAEILSGSF